MLRLLLVALGATYIWDIGLATPVVRNLLIVLILIQLITSGPSVIKDLIKPPRFM